MYEYKVIKIHKVIDGDTVIATVDLGFNCYIKQSFRILRINSPELRDKDPNVKEAAFKAKEFAEKWFLQPGTLIVKTTKDDKYGRMLGDFRFEGQTETYSEIALKNNIAAPYDK